MNISAVQSTEQGVKIQNDASAVLKSRLVQAEDTAVMRCEKLSKHYPLRSKFFASVFSRNKKPSAVHAVDGVSLHVERGQTLAVVGESGCGKSTLARQLCLMETPSSGALWLHGEATAGLTAPQRRALRPQVQMVFQNPYASLNPRHRIFYQLSEPLLIHRKLSAVERKEQVHAIMQAVGLSPELGERYPHMFSGGQRQRIAIARAMVLRPSLLIADEPTSALDVSIQAQIINLFADLQDSMGTAYVFISHNLSVVAHMADYVAVMYLGRIVEYGSAAQIFSHAAHPYTQALLAATPTLRTKRSQTAALQGELPNPIDPPPGCALHQRCPHARPDCKQQVPVLRAVQNPAPSTPSSHVVACHYFEKI